MKKLLLLAFMLLTVDFGLACSCAAAGVEDHLESADTVFQARVTNVEISLIDDVTVVVAPSKVWKGTPREVIYTEEDVGACGYGFIEGKEYIIFAHESEGRFRTGLCSGTILVNDETLAALGDAQEIDTLNQNLDVNSFFSQQSTGANLFWIFIFVAIVVIGIIWHLRARKRLNANNRK